MKTLHVSVAMVALIFSTLAQVTERTDQSQECTCELNNSGLAFPEAVLSDGTNCSNRITSQQMLEVDILLDKLHYRLLQLEVNVKDLEDQDDDGSVKESDLFMAVSLEIIEIELAEMMELINKLNDTTVNHQGLSTDIITKLQHMRSEMESLEQFDRMKVVEKQKENQRLKKVLVQCQNDLKVTPAPLTAPVPGNCPYGYLLNVTGPSTYTGTEYGISYLFGAWGRDPKPAAGKEDWYWLVALTSSNIYANYVRWYSSHSSVMLGVNAGDVLIAASNPTTNTVQGPNVVLYEDALYYGCYNSPSLCRFNMTALTITTAVLPDAGYENKFPFCHMDTCYGYTDMDLATDESGVWVVYSTTENFGNVVLSKVDAGSPPTLGRTWHTSLHKRSVTNTFVACGVLYATRFLDEDTEEIFYALDTVSGRERYDLKLRFRKMSANIHSLNYNPRDRLLYVYSDAYILTYHITFG